MSSQITIYRTTCTKGIPADSAGSGYSLRPWGTNTALIEGYDDGGKLYVLPDGYEMAETIMDEPVIYGPHGHCAIIKHSSEHPQLIDGSDHQPVLLPVIA